jgi:hypothetical protein
MGSKKQAWVVAVDMGYGHQRAAYPLKDIAYERIINANSGKMVTPNEQKQWRRFQRYYEGISRFTSVPVIGKLLFWIYDRLQNIEPFYPFRDLSRPTVVSHYMHRLIRKDFLKSIIDYSRRKELPFISTFFAPAIAAAHAGMKDIYCIVTDTDINRIWVPERPKKEQLFYLTPTEHSTKRLRQYGVPEENIFFTGFPLPKENTGKEMAILKHDLRGRLPNLDPNKVHISRYRDTIQKMLNTRLRSKSNHPLTLTFVVGGAGAQKKLGARLLKSLRHRIKNHEIRVNMVGGTRLEVNEYFSEVVARLKLKKELGTFINIQCALDKKTYFEQFNKLLHTTDILWTKPSELSFYTALGLPIIIAPPLGAHEELNTQWLVRMGAGFRQENPDYVDEWLFEWLDKGILAEAAWEGFLEAPKYGTYNIEKVVFEKKDKKKVKLKY